MGVVMDISDHVVVLSFGELIAAGTPAEVRRNPDVIDAYLGSSAAKAERRDGPTAVPLVDLHRVQRRRLTSGGIYALIAIGFVRRLQGDAASSTSPWASS